MGLNKQIIINWSSIVNAMKKDLVNELADLLLRDTIIDNVISDKIKLLLYELDKVDDLLVKLAKYYGMGDKNGGS